MRVTFADIGWINCYIEFETHPNGDNVNYHEEGSKEIRLKVVYRSTTNFLNDYTANISIGGCFLSTQQPFEIGETIELALILPTGQSINATGIVRWISNDGEFPGVGVQFTLLSDKDRRMIEHLVSNDT